jgi:hypothetical protein
MHAKRTMCDAMRRLVINSLLIIINSRRDADACEADDARCGVRAVATPN